MGSSLSRPAAFMSMIGMAVDVGGFGKVNRMALIKLRCHVLIYKSTFRMFLA
jgi:hypothetical protein